MIIKHSSREESIFFLKLTISLMVPQFQFGMKRLGGFDIGKGSDVNAPIHLGNYLLPSTYNAQVKPRG